MRVQQDQDALQNMLDIAVIQLGLTAHGVPCVQERMNGIRRRQGPLAELCLQRFEPCNTLLFVVTADLREHIVLLRRRATRRARHGPLTPLLQQRLVT